METKKPNKKLFILAVVFFVLLAFILSYYVIHYYININLFANPARANNPIQSVFVHPSAAGNPSSTPGITLYINGSTAKDVKISNGEVSNFTAIISNPNDYVGLYLSSDSGLNNTLIAPLTKGKATYTNVLPNNTIYKVTAFSNSSGVSNVTHFETEADAKPTCTITSQNLYLNNVYA